jgi:cytochrome c553
MGLTQWMAPVMIAFFLSSVAVAVENEQGEPSLRIGIGDPVAGKEKADAGRCLECHGSDGLSGDTRIPNHAGQYAGYLAKQLNDFQSGARQHAVMSVMAEDLDAADIADMAAYFAAQKPMQGRDGSPNRTVPHLFLHGDAGRDIPACAGCHGQHGEGRENGDGTVYPVIGGQRKAYLHSQLVGWKLGERQNSLNGVMNRIAGRLSDDEIEALADYLSGLQPREF